VTGVGGEKVPIGEVPDADVFVVAARCDPQVVPRDGDGSYDINGVVFANLRAVGCVPNANSLVGSSRNQMLLVGGVGQ